MLSLRPLTPVALASFGALILAHSTQSSGKVTSIQTGLRCCPGEHRVFFQLDSASLAPPYGRLSIAANSTLSVFTVPSGKSLVLTDIEALADGVQLVEVTASAREIKRGYVWLLGNDANRYHSSVGLEFGPGAEVSWENLVPYDLSSFYFSISGYLIPE